MKNILVTTIGFSSVIEGGGGISSYTQDLVENLISAGYKLTVFVIRENLPINPIKQVNKDYSLRLFRIPEKKK